MWKPSGGQPKPEGAIDGRSFYVTPAMMSILGAPHDDMELILKGLDYRGEERLESEVKPVEEEPAETTLAEPVSAPDTTVTNATIADATVTDDIVTDAAVAVE